MPDDLFTIYEAATFAEAESIHQTLADEGVDAWVEQTPSPLDGLTNIGEGTEIMIRQHDEQKARRIIERYLAEKGEE